MGKQTSELEARLRRAMADTQEGHPRRLALREPWAESLRAAYLQRMQSGALRSASVLVPIVRRPSALTILLTRRSDQLRAHGGQVSFPGGGREPGDASAAATALREAWEEIGLPPSAVEVFGYLDDYPTMSNFLVTPVVGFVEDVADLRHDPREVARVFELPLEKLLENEHFREIWVEREEVRLPLLELEHEGERIWGATAAMLHEFVQRVRRTA